jgi:phenylpropionate dioxygenase-like ring-hydroxylating dioxygenase large terminal subunit
MSMTIDPTINPADLPRSKGVSYQELLDSDSRPVPVVLRNVSPGYFGDADLPVDRYISKDFFELEVEKLWKKTWQMACREEEIPNVGDTLVYDITDISILMVRTAPDTIKGFYNACLHRGRQLKEYDGPATELRCPFHGYAWSLDGDLTHIPAQWDFPQVSPENFALPQVKVGTWGGFVFINMDHDCEPLESFLGELPSHFERWPLEDRYIQAHVGRLIKTNWKIVQEAFMEAFHVVATHPQLLPGIGDANSQYDVWGNVSRAITPNGTESPHLGWAPTEQDKVDSMVDRRFDEDPIISVPDGMTARQVIGENGRAQFTPIIGAERADALTDAELTDSFYYTLFPNLHPWGAFNRIVYRFRPWGTDPEMAIMECYFLAPFVGERPAPAPLHLLGVDDDWTEAPELGMLARVFNQDFFNLPKVQKGLHTLRLNKPGVTAAVYQETKIRHFHHLLDQALAR